MNSKQIQKYAMAKAVYTYLNTFHADLNVFVPTQGILEELHQKIERIETQAPDLLSIDLSHSQEKKVIIKTILTKGIHLMQVLKAIAVHTANESLKSQTNFTVSAIKELDQISLLDQITAFKNLAQSIAPETLAQYQYSDLESLGTDLETARRLIGNSRADQALRSTNLESLNVLIQELTQYLKEYVDVNINTFKFGDKEFHKHYKKLRIVSSY